MYPHSIAHAENGEEKMITIKQTEGKRAAKGRSEGEVQWNAGKTNMCQHGRMRKNLS